MGQPALVSSCLGKGHGMAAQSPVVNSGNLLVNGMMKILVAAGQGLVLGIYIYNRMG